MFQVAPTHDHTPALRFVLDKPLPESMLPGKELGALFGLLRNVPGYAPVEDEQGLREFAMPLEGLAGLLERHGTEKADYCPSFFDALPGLLGSEAGEGLQINFHQHPFDTDERYWSFIQNQGNLLGYFANRLYWHLAPKLGFVMPYPLHVDIETANTCNMNCPMCYRDKLKNVGQMELGLFRKIVDDCAAHGVFSIRLSWRGEPLTHPDIAEMIRYACSKIRNVSFLTNAFYLSDEIVDTCIEAGVSYIAVSFDGIGEIYEMVRHPAKFEENRDRLRRLRELRAAAGTTRPQIRLCTIWPAIREDPEAYQQAMAGVSDYMVYNPYINFKGPMTLKPDFICQYPWERIVVGFDGQAQCCTGWNATDIALGNMADTDIATVWRSERMDTLRTMHRTGRRMDMQSCAECRHGSKGEPDIDIRDIVERRY